MNLKPIICLIHGHKYPIKWSKEKWPNGEIVETGCAMPYNPCFRCGKVGKEVIVDLEKMYWNIMNDLKEIKKKLNI